jgi:hypothetical protein
MMLHALLVGVATTLALVIITFVALGLLIVVNYFRARASLSRIPGPKAKFPFGNMHMLLDQDGQRLTMVSWQHQLQKSFGDVAKYMIGFQPFVVLSGACATRCMVVNPDVCDCAFSC